MPVLKALALVLALLLPATVAAQLLPAQPQAEAPGPDAAEAARLLAEVIEDPEARAALVAQLRSAADGTGAAATAETTPPDGSIARVVADQTLVLAEGVSASVLEVVESVSDIDAMVTAARGIDWAAVGRDAASLAVVAAATLATFAALRWLTLRPRNAIARRLGGAGWIGRGLGLLAVAAIESVLILLAWGAGYGLALTLGEPGRMDLHQSLFLNAFVLVAAGQLVLRMLFSPDRPALRLPPMPDASAREWYQRPARILAVLGYGVLLAVPMAREAVSTGFGEAVNVAVAVLAAWMAIRLVLRNRQPVRAALQRRAERDAEGIVGNTLGALAQMWHLLAIGYVLGLLLIWATRPTDSLGFMVSATLHSVIAIVAGVAAMSLITRAIAGGVRLSDSLRSRLPTLERQLNTFVPAILSALRLLVFVAVVGTVAQAWGLFDLTGWLTTGAGRDLAQAVLSAAMILLVAGIVWLAVSSWIEFKLNPTGARLVTARERTLLSLLRNAFTVLVVVMAAMLTLSALGVNIAPLLAGAGVVGLAIGFGAQRLVQDIITGAFIQFENAMNTGDVVTAGGVTGVVEKLTIRSVGLRTLDGTYHLIPFSSVDTVSNAMKDFSYHVAEIGVAYREDIGRVKDLMREAFDRLRETEHGRVILGDLDMQGITGFADSAVMLRARIMTRPGQHWAVGRAYNELIKEIFDREGVEIPFPHVTLYMGQDRDGAAPPLNLRPMHRRPAPAPEDADDTPNARRTGT
jgi:small conductance mechanosensitive channel